MACELVPMNIKPSNADFADQAGISRSYACEIASGKRSPSMRMAIDIYRKTGRRFGPVAAMDDADIDVLDRVTPKKDAAA